MYYSLVLRHARLYYKAQIYKDIAKRHALKLSHSLVLKYVHKLLYSCFQYLCLGSLPSVKCVNERIHMAQNVENVENIENVHYHIQEDVILEQDQLIYI